MKTSPRPKRRTKAAEDAAFEAKMGATVARGNKNAQPDKLVNKAMGGKVAGYKAGGMCRGMGAATKGGKYSKSG